MPGAETYSAVQASGNLDGWNDKDLSAQGLTVSGDFWIGTKEFSSSKSFGLDTSSDSGNSYQKAGAAGDWTAVNGNLGYHVYLDCGDNCDDEVCPGLGDMNDDSGYNVMDIVLLANCVLAEDCEDQIYGCAGDMNADGGYNVMDIVLLANCVLAEDCIGRVNDATDSKINMLDNIVSFESNGFIGGVQMTLTHGADFTIAMTDKALFADYLTADNETRLLVITPETDELFSYKGAFEIKDIIMVNSQNEISVELPGVSMLDVPSAGMITEYSLSTAYPNPFNPTTSVTLTVPTAGYISVQVYNIMGQVVATLASSTISMTL